MSGTIIWRVIKYAMPPFCAPAKISMMNINPVVDEIEIGTSAKINSGGKKLHDISRTYCKHSDDQQANTIRYTPAATVIAIIHLFCV